jgi:hypothetical protein
MAKVEIRQSPKSVPPLPHMTVNGRMMQLELPAGNLWDPESVAIVEWGHVDPSGRPFGQVIPHNGKPRRFSDPALMTPYLNAFHAEAKRSGLIADASKFTVHTRATQNV